MNSKTIINVPNDEHIYQVELRYCDEDDTFIITKYRIFAFEYTSTYNTDGTINNYYMVPITLNIIFDKCPFEEFTGVMGDDGTIYQDGDKWENLEEFKKYVKEKTITCT
jgi:hypothetical protein